jgi:hypothetical protein
LPGTSTLAYFAKEFCVGSGEQFKITFVIAHRIPDRILRIVKSELIFIRLYALAMNPNTDKPIEI